MARFRIQGGVSLSGSVDVAGSKNAALPIMAASILADAPVELLGVPQVADVATLSRLLERLGVCVRNISPGSMHLETVDPLPVRADYALVRRMRASFCVLGPLLARRGRAVVSLPGGCNIGHRPVDLHLRGLAALGATWHLENGYVVARAERLTGADVHLGGPRGPTVTGTANVLSAAVLAEGTTTIHDAAVEPEIVDLGHFLIALGAQITGLGTPTIRVRGVERLGGATYRVIPDRIEAATLLLAVAITGGSATVTGARPDHLDAVLAGLRAAGSQLDVAADRITIVAPPVPQPLDIVASPYPAMPTDVQAQWTALLSLASGRSTVADRVFPDRFQHVAELARLGARVIRRGDTATVTGVKQLVGARVKASDLRASAALVLAALAARGQTVIDHIAHLDRGYEQLDEKLNRLGAKIQRLDTHNVPSGHVPLVSRPCR